MPPRPVRTRQISSEPARCPLTHRAPARASAGNGRRPVGHASAGSAASMAGRRLQRIFDVAVLPAAPPIASLRTRREDATVSGELPGQLGLVARNDHYARKAHGQHQSIRALIRRFTVRLSSQSVTDHSREPPPGGLGSQAAGSRSSMVTWRHLQRRRRRYRSRAGPSCRWPGHTSSSSADPRAKPPPARPAAALRRSKLVGSGLRTMLNGSA